MKIFSRVLVMVWGLLLSGCAVLSTSALSIGLREQYIEQNKGASTPDAAVYEVRDASMKGNIESFSRDYSEPHLVVAQYNVVRTGEIVEVPLQPPSNIEPKIHKDGRFLIPSATD